MISTVFNEAANIGEYLASIASLGRLPDELVVVDGGSTDGTLELLQRYAASSPPFPVRVLSEQRCNIARGRNLAVRAASHGVIAVSDAGCRLDPQWLQEITGPLLDGTADVVGGWYEPDARTGFEQAAALCTFTRLARVDAEQFLPSSRSIAFTKKAWESVGGYPEWLTLTAEDTLFDLSLKRQGCRFHFAPGAVVRWRPRQNLAALVKQYYLYGYGDGEARIGAGYLRSALKVGWTLLLAPAAGLAVSLPVGICALAIGLLAYGRSLRALPWRHVPLALVLALIIDVAKLWGCLRGRRTGKSDQKISCTANPR